jgi:hypothetical protein
METKSVYIDIAQSLEALLNRVSTCNDSKDLSTFLDKATKSSKWNYIPVPEMRTLVSELNDLLNSLELEKQPEESEGKDAFSNFLNNIDRPGYKSAAWLTDWIEAYYCVDANLKQNLKT